MPLSRRCSPSKDDPYLQKLPWQDGQVLPPPSDFAARIPGGPKGVFGLDPASGAPSALPIPGFLAYWVAVIRGLKPGHYKIYACAVTGHGDAQPLPRPFAASGVTTLPSVSVANHRVKRLAAAPLLCRKLPGRWTGLGRDNWLLAGVRTSLGEVLAVTWRSL